MSIIDFCFSYFAILADVTKKTYVFLGCYSNLREVLKNVGFFMVFFPHWTEFTNMRAQCSAVQRYWKGLSETCFRFWPIYMEVYEADKTPYSCEFKDFLQYMYLRIFFSLSYTLLLLLLLLHYCYFYWTFPNYFVRESFKNITSKQQRVVSFR